jgi:hypothetical protein
MYETNPDLNTLWQGDVVFGCAFPVFSNLNFTASEWGSQFKVRTGPLAIVSHSCDLETSNGKLKRSYVQVCPLITLPAMLARKPEHLARLRAHEPLQADRPEFINYFLFHAVSGLLDQDMVIDLSNVHSFQASVQVFDKLREHKRLQIQSAVRRHLQDRLMVHYGREAE